MDLSEKTGLSLSYVSMVENGRQKVSLNALIRIANILGVTVDVSIPFLRNSGTSAQEYSVDELLNGNQMYNPT